MRLYVATCLANAALASALFVQSTGPEDADLPPPAAIQSVDVKKPPPVPAVPTPEVCVPPVATGPTQSAVMFAEMFKPTRDLDGESWPQLVPVIREVIEPRLAEMRACDVDGATKPEAGTTWLRLQVDAAGVVRSHRFQRSADGGTELGACIAKTVSGWRYPAMKCAGYAFRFPLRF